MTFANNLDPDEAPQKVGLHLRSKLFDIQIIYQQNIWEETMIFCIFWKKNIWKNYPACKELKQTDACIMQNGCFFANPLSIHWLFVVALALRNELFKAVRSWADKLYCFSFTRLLSSSWFKCLTTGFLGNRLWTISQYYSGLLIYFFWSGLKIICLFPVTQSPPKRYYLHFKDK